MKRNQEKPKRIILENETDHFYLIRKPHPFTCVQCGSKNKKYDTYVVSYNDIGIVKKSYCEVCVDRNLKLTMIESEAIKLFATKGNKMRYIEESGKATISEKDRNINGLSFQQSMGIIVENIIKKVNKNLGQQRFGVFYNVENSLEKYNWTKYLKTFDNATSLQDLDIVIVDLVLDYPVQIINCKGSVTDVQSQSFAIYNNIKHLVTKMIVLTWDSKSNLSSSKIKYIKNIYEPCNVKVFVNKDHDKNPFRNLIDEYQFVKGITYPFSEFEDHLIKILYEWLTIEEKILDIKKNGIKEKNILI